MNSPRHLKDDALFLGALVAVLAGVALLLETTGLMPLPEWAGPIVVLAAGGLLLWFAIVRKRSGVFFGSGVFLVLSGIVLLFSGGGLGLSRSWPLLMTSAGIGWYAFGQWRFGSLRIAAAVPAALFVLLSLFFALFSFRLVKVGFRAFITGWWPLLLIIGGIALFIAYSLRIGRGRGRRRDHRP